MQLRERLSVAAQMAMAGALMAVERVESGAVWNPLSRSYRVNPYPAYRRLRERDPFHRSRAARAWVLTRHADVTSVLRDPRFLADDRKVPRLRKQLEQRVERGYVTREEADRNTMLRTDPPDHTRLRSLVSKAFTPRSVEALRPRIEQIVDELLDAAAKHDRIDVIRELAYPLPVIVIAEMLGIPPADREQFKRWSDDLAAQLGFGNDLETLRRGRAAGQALRAYLEPILEARRREPREDLISGLVAAHDEGDRLTEDEVFSTITLLLVAGNETTTNLIGNGLLALLGHPDQLDMLRWDPDLMPNAVEELLRYDSPVQATSRVVLEDVDVNGHAVRAGDELFLLMGAANRDPEAFARPEELDVTRQDIRHLSFGHGIHYCLGAPLARIEAPVALNALIQRFPDMRLATSDRAWGDNIILRGLKELPVVLR